MDDPMKVYKLLLDAFGPQHWWPGDSPFEVIVGAILTQQAAWRNVELAIGALKRDGRLDIEGIHLMKLPTLERYVRPTGFYRQKARRLRGVVRYLATEWDGDLDAFFSRDVGIVRDELLALDGVGKETADSILLYAAGKPIFVVDAYTRRILERLGGDIELDYDSIQDYFTERLPLDAGLFNEYHALLVKLGKDHCRTKPVCEGCPLLSVCEFGGGGRG